MVNKERTPWNPLRTSPGRRSRKRARPTQGHGDVTTASARAAAHAIRTVVVENHPISRDAPRVALASRMSKLSPREVEVLRLLGTGKTNRQIAKHLFVCDETVKSHVAAILRKLQVINRTRAAILAVQSGLVDA